MASKKKRTQNRKARGPEQPDREPKYTEKQAQAEREAAIWTLPNDSIERLLDSGTRRDELREMFGAEAYEELVRLKRLERSRGVTRGGPIVWILPGIMGSKLGREGRWLDDVIWLDPLDVIRGNLRDLADLTPGGAIVPLDAFDMAYLLLKLRLRLDGFDVEYWPYDWRKSLKETGARLRDAILEKGKPVHLVCHSMGGLVAREAMRGGKLDADAVPRVVQLATPNRGSFAPAMALTNNDDVVEKLAFLDGLDNGRELIDNVFSKFPGLFELLPRRAQLGEFGLWDRETWPHDYLPSQAMLDAASNVVEDIPLPDERFRLIAGVDEETVIAGAPKYEDPKKKEDPKKVLEFEWYSSKAGDGTVPLAFAMMEGLKTWYVPASHGMIANNRDLARAVTDLLREGKTTALDDRYTPPSDRKRVTRRPQVFEGRRGRAVSTFERRMVLAPFVAPPAAKDVTGSAISRSFESGQLTPEPPMCGVVIGRRRQHRLDVILANASITDVKSRAYVIGAFQGVEPRGAAEAIDTELDGAIREFTMRRMFSASVGEVFTIPAGRSSLTADYVVVTGLGGFDAFDGGVQEQVAENTIRAMVKTHIEEFATVLFGTGSGASVKETLTRMIHGFVRGLLDSDGKHQFRQIVLCERDSERYAELSRALVELSVRPILDEVELTITEIEPIRYAPRVRLGTAGEAARLQAEPIYLHVETRIDPSVVAAIPRKSAMPRRGVNADLPLRVSLLDTIAKASILVRDVRVDAKDLDSLIDRLSQAGNWSAWCKIGSELADLVIHDDIRRAMRLAFRDYADRTVVVLHDAPASRIPWEAVRLDNEAFGVGCGLSRRYLTPDLSIAKYLEKGREDGVLDILLVENPTGDLDGATEEAKRIREIVKKIPGVRLHQRVKDEATRARLLADFSSGDFDVIHYSGHAHFDTERPERSGLLCADDAVLTGTDIAQLVHAPSLVFFNACESARLRGVRARLQRTVSFAEAFLRGGVCQFIGTYWPVNDTAAKTFASEFYRVLASGSEIGEAIDTARKQLDADHEIDAANYIHFGSRRFRVRRSR